MLLMNKTWVKYKGTLKYNEIIINKPMFDQVFQGGIV